MPTVCLYRHRYMYTINKGGTALLLWACPVEEYRNITFSEIQFTLHDGRTWTGEKKGGETEGEKKAADCFVRQLLGSQITYCPKCSLTFKSARRRVKLLQVHLSCNLEPTQPHIRLCTQDNCNSTLFPLTRKNNSAQSTTKFKKKNQSFYPRAKEQHSSLK